jgi:hypothetical protein
MKSILILLLVLTPTLIYSQINKSTTLPNQKSKTFNWKGGDEKIYSVKFNNLLEKPIKKELMDNLVMNIMVYSKLEIKNSLTYRPIELSIFENEDGKINGFTKSSAKNNYGVEKMLTSYFEMVNDSGSVKLLFTNEK